MQSQILTLIQGTKTVILWGNSVSINLFKILENIDKQEPGMQRSWTSGPLAEFF